MKEYDAIELIQESRSPPRVWCELGGKRLEGYLTGIQRTLDSEPLYTVGDKQAVRQIDRSYVTGTILMDNDEEVEAPLSEIHLKPQLERRMDEALKDREGEDDNVRWHPY